MASKLSFQQRWPQRLALAALLVLLTALTLLGWIVGSESGARLALSSTESLSGGAIRIGGIRGRLAGPLHIEELLLEQADRRITVTDLALDWHPTALLSNTLHIGMLHAGHLAVVSKVKKESEPPRLPQHIGLPLALQLDDVQIDDGEFITGAVSLFRLGPLAFKLNFDGGKYRLQLRQLAIGSEANNNRTIAASFAGEATLAATRPYALQGRFSSKGSALMQEQEREQNIGATSNIALDGSLAELKAVLDLSINQAQVKSQATLKPFSDNPLGAIQLNAHSLDLNHFDHNLPRTALNIALSSSPAGAGELLIGNAAPGTLDEGKLPLSDLRLAFRQNPAAFHFDRMTAVLGTTQAPAGTITGNGQWADGALTIQLLTEKLDIKRIDQRLRSTRLAGTLDFRHTGGKQEFTLALSEPLGKQQAKLTAQGVLAESELRLDRAQLQAGSGRIDASARISLAGRQSFSIEGKANRLRLQELGNFPQLPALDLSGDFSLLGTRQPQLEGDLAFHITDSRLAGSPLLGKGEAHLRANRLSVPDLLLISGINRLHLQGELAQEHSRLRFTLEAPQLAQLGPKFGGAMYADGIVDGTLMQPRIHAEWRASNTRLPGALQIDRMQGKADIGIDRYQDLPLRNTSAEVTASGLRFGADQIGMLTAQGRFSPQANAPLALNLQAQGIATSQLQADRFTVSANGTTARHAIDAGLSEPAQTWALKAAGGLQQLTGKPRWQGRIDTFDAKGRVNAHLSSPAELLLAPQRIQLDRFALDMDGARIAVDQFSRDSDTIATRGRIEQLRIASFLHYVEPAPPLRTDLQLAGEWDVQLADRLSGSISLRREGGDVTVLGNTPVTLGLRNLAMAAKADAGRLSLRLDADGRQLGLIGINANAALGQGTDRLSIPPDTPLSGSARIMLPSLAWIAPLLSPTLIADGRLQSDISIAGTLGRPAVTGRMAGDALRINLTDLGIDLRQGTLQSEFRDNRFLIQSLAFQGGEGKAVLSGPVNFGAGENTAQLALNAQRFTLFNRSDRRIVVSGDSRIGWEKQHTRINGAFTIDSGFIDIGRADTPRLSDDVMIAGREHKPDGSMGATVDVTISLGDGIAVQGRGVSATLAGKVRVTGSGSEALQGDGTLRAERGSYTAYGHELAIEKGVLRFDGALTNPGLDVLAMRRGQEVEAGISIRGTVLTPRVTLVSEPAVPDAEKLSWLVLGRGLASTKEDDAGPLQEAAGALLSQGAAAGVQSRLASAFGLNTLSVGKSQSNLQQRVVTLGKQLSSRLYVSYRQGLGSASSVVQLRYTLSPHLSLEGEAGTRSALSLFYNMAFD